MLEDDAPQSAEPALQPIVNIQVVAAPTSPTAPAAAPAIIGELPAELAGTEIRPVSAQTSSGNSQGSSGVGGGPGVTGNGGGPLFALPARAQRVVFVIDRSVSMGLNGALDAVKRELLASLARLPGDCRFQIVFYNRSAAPLFLDGRLEMFAATAANRDAVAHQLDALEAEGGTDHLPALSRALAFDPDLIFFLTDADDLRPDQVRYVTQLNRGRAAIHTIELTTANARRPDMPLQVLARENRGSYRAVSLP